MEVINSKQIVLRMSNQNGFSKNNYFEILNVLRTLFVEKDFTTRVETLKMSTKTKIPRKPCLVLKIWDCEFNRENESRQAKINLFIYYPVSEINGTPSEEVKLKKKLNKFA